MTWIAPTDDRAAKYDRLVKDATQAISKVMDDLGTVHDGIQIHVNHFGQWVAKYKTQDGTIHYAFGATLLMALQNLRDDPNKEI